VFPIKCRAKIREYLIECNPRTKVELRDAMLRFARKEGLTREEIEACYFCLISNGDIDLIE